MLSPVPPSLPSGILILVQPNGRLRTISEDEKSWRLVLEESEDCKSDLKQSVLVCGRESAPLTMWIRHTCLLLFLTCCFSTFLCVNWFSFGPLLSLPPASFRSDLPFPPHPPLSCFSLPPYLPTSLPPYISTSLPPYLPTSPIPSSSPNSLSTSASRTQPN